MAKVDNIYTSDFVLKTNFNTKITELENKISDISHLATKTALTTVENKINLTTNVFNVRLAQANIIKKNRFWC